MDFDIAGICAHPDDAELVMGGTLAREAARGRRVCMVDLTRGESGSRGTPETRAAEAQEAARVLGVAHRTVQDNLRGVTRTCAGRRLAYANRAPVAWLERGGAARRAA